MSASGSDLHTSGNQGSSRADGAGRTWAIITPEYPPELGGIADHTAQIARALATAGDLVHVWSPRGTRGASVPGVTVHALPGGFGAGARRQLEAELATLTGRVILLIQYVPHGFGWKAMNLPFCQWLSRRREPLWVLFHEVALSFVRGQPWRHHLLALTNRVMARVVARRAARLFVTIPAWKQLLPPLSRTGHPIGWLPVPSNLPTHVDRSARQRVRAQWGVSDGVQLVGHFGTYGSFVRAPLASVLAALLRQNPTRCAVLIGQRGVDFARELRAEHPSLAARVIAPGRTEPSELSEQVSAVDLMVFPFVDGVSSRRTSLMAALAAGVATLTTEGVLTEPLWRSSGAVALAPPDPVAIIAAAEGILANPEGLRTLGAAGAALYKQNFGIEQLIERLRSCALADEGRSGTLGTTALPPS